MARNPERRTGLLNAAIDVLAAQGARGLTYRAVDEQAGVPVGTTSNYFAGRDDLLRQISEHIFVRLTPDPARSAELMSAPADRDLEVVLMRDLIAQAHEDRAGYLALFELRLEAVRRPEIHEALTAQFRNNLDQIVRGHVSGGFPGDRATAVLLYLAMNGLLLEALTLPEVLGEQPLDELAEQIVNTIVPPA